MTLKIDTTKIPPAENRSMLPAFSVEEPVIQRRSEIKEPPRVEKTQFEGIKIIIPGSSNPIAFRNYDSYFGRVTYEDARLENPTPVRGASGVERVEFSVNTSSEQRYEEGSISYNHGTPIMVKRTRIRGQLSNGERTTFLDSEKNNALKEKAFQNSELLEQQFPAYKTKYMLASEDGRVFILSQKKTDSNTVEKQNFIVHEMKENGSLVKIPVGSAINSSYRTRCRCDAFVIKTPAVTFNTDEGIQKIFNGTISSRNTELRLAEIK